MHDNNFLHTSSALTLCDQKTETSTASTQNPTQCRTCKPPARVSFCPLMASLAMSAVFLMMKRATYVKYPIPTRMILELCKYLKRAFWVSSQYTQYLGPYSEARIASPGNTLAMRRRPSSGMRTHKTWSLCVRFFIFQLSRKWSIPF